MFRLLYLNKVTSSDKDTNETTADKKFYVNAIIVEPKCT